MQNNENPVYCFDVWQEAVNLKFIIFKSFGLKWNTLLINIKFGCYNYHVRKKGSCIFIKKKYSFHKKIKLAVLFVV